MNIDEAKDLIVLADEFKFDIGAARERGLSMENISSMLHGQLNQRKQEIAQQKADQQAGAASSALDTGLAAFGKGFDDVLFSTFQAGAKGLNAISDDLVSDEFVEGVAQTAREKANEPVFQAMAENNSKSALAGGIAGELGALGPTMLIPGANAPKLGTRIASGATQGGIAGALARPSQDNENFLQDKLIDGSIGAVTGGISGAASPLIDQFLGFVGRKGADAIKSIGALKDKIVGKVGKISDMFDEFGNMTDRARTVIIKDGGDPASLETQMKAILEKQKEFGDLTPEEQARFAVFAEEGIDPRTSQVSQDFIQQKQEEAISKTTSQAGNELRSNIANQERQISDRINELAEGTGGRGDFLGAEDLGANLSNPTKTKSIETQAEVSKAYKAVRDSGGDTALVPKDDFLSNADEIIEEFDDFIPNAILKKLSNFRDETVDFTIGEAEKLRKQLGRLGSLSNDNSAREGMRLIKESLDDTVTDVSEGFTKARAKAKARFASQESAEAKKAAGKVSVDDIATGKIPDEKLPAKLLSKSTTSKDFSKIIDFWQTGTAKQKEAGKQAVNNLKRFIIDEAGKAGFKGGGKVADGVNAFSGRAFKKFLDTVGDKKLARIMTKKERQTLANLVRIGELKEPLRGVVNFSNTASSRVDDVLRFTAKVPGFGRLSNAIADVAQAVKTGGKDRVAKKQADEAVNPISTISEARKKANKKTRKDKFRKPFKPIRKAIPASSAALALELREDN